MKIIVIADSHGNIANLKQVLGFAKKIKAGAVIHCGDWDNLAAVETVLAAKIPFYAVLGNADIDGRVANSLQCGARKFAEKVLEFEIEGRKIGVTHQHEVSDTKYGDVLFQGHKHKQEEFVQDEVRIINPGALENKINFAIYDTRTNKVELIHDQS